MHPGDGLPRRCLPDGAKRGWKPGGDYSASKNESAEPTASQEEDDRVHREVPPASQALAFSTRAVSGQASTMLKNGVRNQLRSNKEPKEGGGGGDHKDQRVGMKQPLVLTGYETL